MNELVKNPKNMLIDLVYYKWKQPFLKNIKLIESKIRNFLYLKSYHERIKKTYVPTGINTQIAPSCLHELFAKEEP